MTHRRNLGPRRRRVAVVLAGLTLTAACGSSEPDSEDTSTGSTPPASSSSTTPGSSASSATSVVETTPIDGTWTTPPLTPSDFRSSLTRQQLGAHVDAFLSDFGSEVDLTLEIGGGFWTLSSSIDGGPQSVTDRGNFEVQGTRVLVLPNSGGENLFNWSVTGDELALSLVSTTEPSYEGVPAETYQRGLYTTSPFRSAS